MTVNEYELVYIITPRKAPADVDAVVEWVGQQVATAGGEVMKVNQWGRRRLAYPIDHHFEGTYVLAHVQLPPNGAVVLEAALHITDDVIRHMLTRGIVNPEGSAPPEYVGERPRFAPRAGAPAPGASSEAPEGGADGAPVQGAAEASTATAVAEAPAEAADAAEAPVEAPAEVAEAPVEAAADAPAAEAAVAVEAPVEAATAEATLEAPAEAEAAPESVAEAAPSESVEAAVETAEAPADEADAKPAQPAAE